jgi:IS5 family transposase
VALRNTDEIKSFAGDKGYDNQSLRDALRSEGVRLVIRHGLFAHHNHTYNSRLDSELYRQCWMADTGSLSGRAPGTAFRELVLTATVYNPEQAIKG